MLIILLGLFVVLLTISLVLLFFVLFVIVLFIVLLVSPGFIGSSGFISGSFSFCIITFTNSSSEFISFTALFFPINSAFSTFPSSPIVTFIFISSICLYPSAFVSSILYKYSPFAFTLLIFNAIFPSSFVF